ncbi:MAG: hypothetical protein RIS47_1590, partial [Bacteroidota bacterium]
TRKQIELYQQVEGVRYREDSSNASLKYVRNKIRHDIVPRFEDIFDNYSDAVVKNIDRLREIEMVYMSAIDTARASSLLASDTQTVISISKLKQLSPLRTYLFEFLKPFDFSAATVDDIILVLDRQPGRQFYSHSHRLIKNRDELIIVPLVEEAVASVLVNENQEQVEIKQDDNSSLRLRLSRIAKTDGYEISRDRNTATLDADNLSWPLELRRWNQGDFFYPFGMKGRKLVSDYFTDEKFSLLQKEQTWLLCSDSRVVWIVGHRTDNRFKVEAHTQDLLVLSVL